MLRFMVQFTSLFALALWVGGGVAISFFAAPSIFEAAGSRQLAGTIVGRILERFEFYLLVVGPIAMLAVLVELAGTVGAPTSLTLKLWLVGAMFALLLYSRFAIHPEIRKLRATVGDIDGVAPADHRRKAFGRLHGLSVVCLLGQILLGAFALALTIIAHPAR